jgi:hypothetical protein
MPTTQQDIRGWLLRGKAAGARYMLVVCDSFDYEDYPVFVNPNEDIQAKAQQYNGVNMQRIMECYDLEMDWELQLNTGRAFNGWPNPSPASPKAKEKPTREDLMRKANTEL